jgi:hypothetical protein
MLFYFIFNKVLKVNILIEYNNYLEKIKIL